MVMTEVEWLECQEPFKLVQAVPKRSHDRGRKLRLFAAACCRRIWECFGDERSRKSVVSAEEFADGKASVEELAAARKAARNADRTAKRRWSEANLPMDGADYVAVCATVSASMVSYQRAMDAALYSPRPCEAAAAGSRRLLDAHTGERREQVRLFHCIFGNPFRAVHVDPGWLGWRDGTIVKLAQAIYDKRAFHQLPILADALEEAGCGNIDILNHCREPGEHARGCWVVDLVLRSK